MAETTCEIRLDRSGDKHFEDTPDEVIFKNAWMVHFERMDDDQLWCGVTGYNGEMWRLWFWRKGKRLLYRCENDGASENQAKYAAGERDAETTRLTAEIARRDALLARVMTLKGSDALEVRDHILAAEIRSVPGVSALLAAPHAPDANRG